MRKLGRKQLSLQLPQPLAELPSALAAWPLLLAKGGNEILYSYDASEQTGAAAGTGDAPGGIVALLAALTAAGVAFKDLHTSQSSLEDIFVTLVHDNSKPPAGTLTGTSTGTTPSTSGARA
jgi:ABC-2 type transport system ATP-binding protein